MVDIVLDESKQELLITETTKLKFDDNVQYHYDNIIADYTDGYEDFISDELADKFENYSLTDNDKMEILESIKDEWEKLNREMENINPSMYYFIHDEDVIINGIKNWIRENLI
jgi:hypothetical protein